MQLLNINALVPRIWAKMCMLDRSIIWFDMITFPWWWDKVTVYYVFDRWSSSQCKDFFTSRKVQVKFNMAITLWLGNWNSANCWPCVCAKRDDEPKVINCRIPPIIVCWVFLHAVGYVCWDSWEPGCPGLGNRRWILFLRTKAPPHCRI